MVRRFMKISNVIMENNENNNFLADDDETMETTNQKHVSLEDIIEKPESSNAYTASKTHKKIVCK